MAAFAVWGILLIAFIAWMLFGIHQVQPGEQGIRRTFGKFSGIESPGLKWHWPTPVGQTRVVAVEQTRSMELGFRQATGGVLTAFQKEARMITGDLNVVDAQLVVQYKIGDLEDFIFRVADPGDPDRLGLIEPDSPEGRTLKDATESALRLVVGQRSVDVVRTQKRPEVQAETQRVLQGILDEYQAGIQVLTVRLQDVVPPGEVRDAFDDVLRARQEKETAENLAEAYRRDQIPRAQGQAARITQSAEAFKQERINRAEGEAQRFEAVLAEYLQSQDVTRQRLYLEAMEQILPNISKFIVSPEASGGIILNSTRQAIVPVPNTTSTLATPVPAPVPAQPTPQTAP
jgi:membrane protease subunit HflK